jgi:hypothetical protein
MAAAGRLKANKIKGVGAEVVFGTSRCLYEKLRRSTIMKNSGHECSRIAKHTGLRPEDL